MSTIAIANERQSLIFAAAQALAYLDQGLDFTEIDCLDGEAQVVVAPPRPIDRAHKSFIAGVCLLSELGWRQERFGDEEGIAHMVRSWREEVEHVAEEGIEEVELSSLFDTSGDLALAVASGHAFISANHELIDEAANFIDAAGRYVEYSAFAAIFLDRVVHPAVTPALEGAFAFDDHDDEIFAIGSKIEELLAGAERAS